MVVLGITAGLARDSALSNPGSGCRGDAMLPFEPTRPAHCQALPALRRGVTAPPSTALTKGGISPSPRARYGFGARWRFTPRPCPPGVATASTIPGGKAVRTPPWNAANQPAPAAAAQTARAVLPASVRPRGRWLRPPTSTSAPTPRSASALRSGPRPGFAAGPRRARPRGRPGAGDTPDGVDAPSRRHRDVP